MANKNYYRDLAENNIKAQLEKIESIQSEITNVITGDLLDDIESEVNEAKDKLQEVAELDIEEFSKIKEEVESTLEILSELSDKLY